MENFAERVDDFSGYVSELVRWINEEDKEFLYTERLLECGLGICSAFKEASVPCQLQKSYESIVAQADEFACLMELMVRTGVITEIQSRPLLSECRAMRAKAEGLLPGDDE